MNRAQTANYNGRLTTYAAGLSQDIRSAGIADFVFPAVQTGTASGQYKKYSGKNAFQVVETLRSLGGPAKRIQYASEDPHYNCKPNSLEIAVDDFERQLAGDITGAQASLEETKTSTVVTSARLAREVAAQKKIDALTAMSGVGQWSDDSKDPIAEIDKAIQDVYSATGIAPNRIAIGLTAWQILRNHPKTIARQPGATIVGLSTDQLAKSLSAPVEIKIGAVSMDKNKFGKGKDLEELLGAKVLIFIGSPTPTTYDPSFGKTFCTKAGGVDAVYTYREPNTRSDIIAVDWSEEMQVIFPEAAALIALS